MALWGGRFRRRQINGLNSSTTHCGLTTVGGAGHHRFVSWSKALVTVNVLSSEEQQLEAALNALLEEVRANPQQILQSDAEDIHSWVEGKLIDKVGALGKSCTPGAAVTTVATDLKLWCKTQVALLLEATRELQSALVATAEANQDAVMPGYTHLQRAQPVTLPTGVWPTLRCWRATRAVCRIR